jgi:hypothetical protein
MRFEPIRLQRQRPLRRVASGINIACGKQILRQRQPAIIGCWINVEHSLNLFYRRYMSILLTQDNR